MKSRPGVLLEGQAPARIRHCPEVRSNAWEDVSDLARGLGLTLDDWQEEVLRGGLGERSDGTWQCRQVAASCPRQNGKSEIIVARILAGLLLFGEGLIIVSAHRQDTSREIFHRLVHLIEANAALEDRVDFIGRSETREYIRMKPRKGEDRARSQEVRFKARSAGAGRGFSADLLLLDEAMLGLGSNEWSAILPTMSARPNSQVWLFGTPPVTEGSTESEVFTRFRQAGIEGRERRLAYLEWSADEGDDLDDPETWAKANPAFPGRITREAIEAERATMSDEQFRVERLGMWSARESRSVLPAPSWATQVDEQSIPVDRFALGVEVGPDMAWASISLAGQRADGDWHIELDDDQHTRGRGVAWLVPAIEHLVVGNPAIRAVVADVAGPIKTLLEEKNGRWWLKGTSEGVRIEITPVKVSELGSACAVVLSGIVAGGLWHIGQPQLSAAALAAGKRALGDTGMWVWNRRSAESDITQIQAGTLALHGARADKVISPLKRGAGRGRRSSGRRVVVYG